MRKLVPFLLFVCIMPGQAVMAQPGTWSNSYYICFLRNGKVIPMDDSTLVSLKGRALAPSGFKNEYDDFDFKNQRIHFIGWNEYHKTISPITIELTVDNRKIKINLSGWIINTTILVPFTSGEYNEDDLLWEVNDYMGKENLKNYTPYRDPEGVFQGMYFHASGPGPRDTTFIFRYYRKRDHEFTISGNLHGFEARGEKFAGREVLYNNKPAESFHLDTSGNFSATIRTEGLDIKEVDFCFHRFKTTKKNDTISKRPEDNDYMGVRIPLGLFDNNRIELKAYILKNAYPDDPDYIVWQKESGADVLEKKYRDLDNRDIRVPIEFVDRVKIIQNQYKQDTVPVAKPPKPVTKFLVCDREQKVIADAEVFVNGFRALYVEGIGYKIDSVFASPVHVQIWHKNFLPWDEDKVDYFPPKLYLQRPTEVYYLDASSWWDQFKIPCLPNKNTLVVYMNPQVGKKLMTTDSAKLILSKLLIPYQMKVTFTYADGFRNMTHKGGYNSYAGSPYNYMFYVQKEDSSDFAGSTPELKYLRSSKEVSFAAALFAPGDYMCTYHNHIQLEFEDKAVPDSVIAHIKLQEFEVITYGVHEKSYRINLPPETGQDILKYVETLEKTEGVKRAMVERLVFIEVGF